MNILTLPRISKFRHRLFLMLRTEAECRAEFDALFPHGPAGADVLRDIAPDGWERSPLLAVFHPSVQQAFEEAVRLHRNLESLPWRDPNEPKLPEPTFEEIANDF